MACLFHTHHPCTPLGRSQPPTPTPAIRPVPQGVEPVAVPAVHRGSLPLTWRPVQWTALVGGLVGIRRRRPAAGRPPGGCRPREALEGGGQGCSRTAVHRRRRGGTPPPGPPPLLPFQCWRLTAKILLRRLRIQEDLRLKIFGPPSAGTIGEGGVSLPNPPPPPCPPDPLSPPSSTSLLPGGEGAAVGLHCSAPGHPRGRHTHPMLRSHRPADGTVSRGPPQTMLGGGPRLTSPPSPRDALEAGRSPPPPLLQGAQPMPSHCLPHANCQPQWHL